MDNIVKEMEDAKQRKRSLEFMRNKRSSWLDYLKKVYTVQEDREKKHWLNIVELDPKEIVGNLDDALAQKRATMWFLLGINLAPLMKIENVPTYVRSMAQMMEEFDYYISNHGTSCTLAELQKHVLLRYKSVSVNLDNEYEAVKPKLHKVGHQVAFEFLQPINIPCELDYCHIVFALCTVLKTCYEKFHDECCTNRHIFDTINKLDNRLKTYFFGVLQKEAHNLAKRIVKEQTANLESLFKAWEGVIP